MKFKTINETNSPLLKRKELNIDIEFEGATPKKDNLKKELAGFLKSKEDLIVIKHIYTNFGSTSAKLEVFIYNDAESLKNIEIVKEKKKKVKKKENAEEKKKE